MDKDIQPGSTLALFLFSIQVILNWLYMLWVKSQPDIIANAWFYVTPIIGYFYFAFAFIAGMGLFYKKRLGLTLAYCVILFGTLSAVISYTIGFNHHPLITGLIIPLIALNAMTVGYMAWKQNQFPMG